MISFPCIARTFLSVAFFLGVCYFYCARGSSVVEDPGQVIASAVRSARMPSIRCLAFPGRVSRVGGDADLHSGHAPQRRDDRGRRGQVEGDTGAREANIAGQALGSGKTGRAMRRTGMDKNNQGLLR